MKVATKKNKEPTKMEREQAELDTIKWRDSQIAGKDTCGTYEFCKVCDKSLDNPCIRAKRKAKKLCQTN